MHCVNSCRKMFFTKGQNNMLKIVYCLVTMFVTYKLKFLKLLPNQKPDYGGTFFSFSLHSQLH